MKKNFQPEKELLFLALVRSRRALLWTLAAAAAVSPDVVKFMHDGFKILHADMHFTRGPGYWFYRVLGPGGDVFAWERFSEPWFQLGFLFEIAFEAIVLIGGVSTLRREPSPAAPEERSPQLTEESPVSA